MPTSVGAPPSRRGSLWTRWDLHVHTPSSFEYGDKSVTNQQIVDRLLAEGIRVVAITDHHTIDVTRIRALQAVAQDRLTILPGVELRSELGGKPIHYICVFPEDSDLDHIWTHLEGGLGLTPADIAAKGGNDRIWVPIKDGATLTHKLGGMVSIHAGDKSNSIEGISNRQEFQQRIKYDIARDYVDLMEIGQLKDIARHWEIIFPATNLEKPLIICSDNHNIETYAVKASLWMRCDPTFRGLRMILREPRERVFIGDRPPSLARVEQNPTKYVRRVRFTRRPGVPAGEQWFSGDVEFNDGLVAIIGNKGSGKSALSDTLGLLGSTKNAAFFSFLSPNRFRHATEGRAQFFDATLVWESGDAVTRSLAETVKVEEVERLKYLPQDHVERVCNELVGLGEQGFEQELKSVIFSHVPEAQRLDHPTFDELVRFQTGEKQNRIDSLFKQLREVNRSRAALEAQADPVVRRNLSERIGQRKLELEAHDKARPQEVRNPTASGATAPDAEVARKLAAADAAKKDTLEQIAAATTELSASERRHAVAQRLLEKLANFEKDFAAFSTSLTPEATELGLEVAHLAQITINRDRVIEIRDEASAASKSAGLRLDSRAERTPGLRLKFATIETELSELRAGLDAPHRAYQAYLATLAEWQARRDALEGNLKSPESLKGLEAALAALDSLPARIAEVREQQTTLSLQIHSEKKAQADVYRALYGPVQAFIDTHPLAKDKLKLEFRVELTTDDFPGKLLSLLALNRLGSFMGVDEGRARAEALVQATKWEDEASARNFLAQVDSALHIDQRDGKGAGVQLKDQLMKGRKAEEVFDLLYGLDYVRPRYILRWEGKDLSMLSPGERGTLLLVFYLLIDKGDMPLIIDQPEGNLDNHTVARVLVDCIRAARQRRQVFIVTHNPNLAVVCDADQVIHARMDKEHGNLVTYDTGSLENPLMSQYVTDVLEGTRWAFDVRDKKYRVGEA
jgi:hypothetical protein